MSILLEALKKSEEQRQLGKAPNIHSPAGEPASGTDGGPQWVPLGMMTLAAIAMAWIGWQQFRLPPESGAANTTEVAANEAPVEMPQPDGQQPAPAAVDTGPAPTEAPTETVMARRPQVVAKAGGRTPVESFKPDTRALADAKVMPPAEPGPADAPVTQGVAQTEPPQARPAAREDGGAQPRTAQSKPAADAPQPHTTEPISFWELPQNVRDDLPDLRISVLVYAERPDDRFVLIGGQRFIEKETVDGRVVLEEIRRKGAVFSYRTYRFLVEG